MTNKKSEIIIIGGGVIGMSCAVELAQRGVQVTVIDKGQPGYGCSYGNAGWMTPCFAMPLPMPGMLFKSMKWMLNPEGPLYIKPAFNPLLFKWLTTFLMSMGRKKMMSSVDVLVNISKYSLDFYKDLDKKHPGAFAFEQKGLLMVSHTEAGVNAAVHELELVKQHGIPGKTLSADEVLKLEPSLRGPIKGGVYFTGEAHGEPLKVVETLVNVAKGLGVTIIPGAEVFHFNHDGGVIRSLQTTRGEMSADQYILATASWSVPIAKHLGLSIPILGGKGYAIITDPLSVTPKIPMMLVEKKIAVTPRNGTLRLAGTLELVDQDDGITTRRVKAILKGAREFLDVPTEPKIHEVWRGLRPCTPDGVPMIGYTKKYSNLFMCTGHQMLGLQSAPGSGRLAADLITKQTPLVDPKPFDANRF